MNTNYPKNCWYVAATGDEVGETPLGRRLFGTDVVLWRDSGGTVHAFEDRCAHRAFPMSHGRVSGDQLVCSYHGCTYDTDGVCVYTPTQPKVPTMMRVRVLPVLQDGPLVWIWPGRPGAAATQRPPVVPRINQPGWTTFASAWHVDANYMMVHEHYLDFSYAPVLHKQDLPADLETMGAFNDVEVTETTVSYTRVLGELGLAAWQSNATGLDPAGTYKHCESGEFVSPALHRQTWEIQTASGELFITTRNHFITPETDDSTHVFMQSSRDYALDSEDSTEGLRSFLAEVAERDTAVLEMVSEHSGYDGWRSGVEFQADAAALRARRIVEVMLAKEAGRSAVRPGLSAKSRSYPVASARPARSRG